MSYSSEFTDIKIAISSKQASTYANSHILKMQSFFQVSYVLKQNSNHKSTNEAKHFNMKKLFKISVHVSPFIKLENVQKNVVVCQADLHSSKITNFFKLILTLDSLKYSFISSSYIQIKMVLFRWGV